MLFVHASEADPRQIRCKPTPPANLLAQRIAFRYAQVEKMKIPIIILGLITSIDVFGCQCFYKVTPEKSNIEFAVEEYDWIGIGIITDVDKSKYPLEYKLSIDNIYKGGAKISHLESGIGGGDCGFVFEIGETYLIYGTKSLSEGIRVSRCSRTKNIKETADQDYLEKYFKNPDFKFHWSELFTNYIQLKTNQQIDVLNPPIIIRNYECIGIQQLIEENPSYYELQIIRLNPSELKKVNPIQRNKIINGGILIMKVYNEKVKKRKIIRKINKTCA